MPSRVASAVNLTHPRTGCAKATAGVRPAADRMQRRRFRTVTPVLPARELDRRRGARSASRRCPASAAGARPSGYDRAIAGIGRARTPMTPAHDGTVPRPTSPSRPCGARRSVDWPTAARVGRSWSARAWSPWPCSCVGAASWPARATRTPRSTELRHHGVPVTVTVTGCRACSAGAAATRPATPAGAPSPSAATRYNEAIPGNTFYPREPTVGPSPSPATPALVSTRPSWPASSASAKRVHPPDGPARASWRQSPSWWCVLVTCRRPRTRRRTTRRQSRPGPPAAGRLLVLGLGGTLRRRGRRRVALVGRGAATRRPPACRRPGRPWPPAARAGPGRPGPAATPRPRMNGMPKPQ